MSGDDRSRLRPPPAERFAAAERVIDLRATFERLRAEPLEARHGHRQVTVLHQAGMTMVVFDFLEHGELAEHMAPGWVTIHVLEGAMEVTTPAGTQSLDSGQLLILAPSLRHAVRARRASQMLLTVHLLEPIPCA